MKNSKLKTEFTFAGFTFPRYVASLPQGSLPKRLKDSKTRCTGDYFHAPKPIAGRHPGRGFYLEDAGQVFTRWQWADDVVSLKHTGWFCDEFQDSKMRGIVARLPHGRFLAGWSMGEGMASEIDGQIYTDETEAGRAADSMAESAAETEREYQEEQEAEREAAQARIDSRFSDAMACGL